MSQKRRYACGETSNEIWILKNGKGEEGQRKDE